MPHEEATMTLVALSEETARLSKALYEKLSAHTAGTPERKMSGTIRTVTIPREEPEEAASARTKV